MTILLAAILAASPLPTGETLRPLRSAAGCLVWKDRVGAADLAFTEPGSSEEAAMAANLKALPSCSKGISISRIADAVALQLFNELKVSQSHTALSREAEDGLANTILAKAEYKTSEAAALHCLAELRPEATGAFIRARPDTSDEREALKAVRSAMPQCVPAGIQVKWTPVDLRLGLARGAYRKSAAHDAILKGY